jgi:hypothetical protein
MLQAGGWYTHAPDGFAKVLELDDRDLTTRQVRPRGPMQLALIDFEEVWKQCMPEIVGKWQWPVRSGGLDAFAEAGGASVVASVKPRMHRSTR